MQPDPSTDQPDQQDTPPTTTLRFRHRQGGLGVSRLGRIQPGGQLIIEYDPVRLAPEDGRWTTSIDIVCHVRFQPSREQHSRSVLEHAEPVFGQTRTPRSIAFGVRVPIDTRLVELWFERRGQDGTTGWDSRYGRNYTFAVADEGLPTPDRSVMMRPAAVVDRGRIHVVEDSASKQQASMHPSGVRLHTELVVRARIMSAAASTTAWADVHIFDATGELIHAGRVALRQPKETAAADQATLVWDGDVYQGSGGGSGMGVWSRPDAHTVQYRLYCELNGQVLTDGILHQFEVRADEEVAQVSGGR